MSKCPGCGGVSSWRLSDGQRLGQPLTFELKGAAPMIDRVLTICSAGP